MVPKHLRFAALAALLLAPCGAGAQDPGPQPRPAPSQQTESPDGLTTTIVTAQGIFPSSDPFLNPTNLLPTVYTNLIATGGAEIPNTLPSTPEQPYNLHPDPTVTLIDPTSPTDDLTAVFARLDASEAGAVDQAAVKLGLDILAGNPVPGRIYSGMPLLHYNGPNKIKIVAPVHDGSGKLVGGTVTIHQIWYDGHIESDTALLDPSAVLNVPWTITYVVDTLNRGKEDFSPAGFFTDDPKVVGQAAPGVVMDQTFFPMNDGTRSVFTIAMPPGRFWSFSYHWGWRQHPPRIQAMSNALDVASGKSLPEWESDVFGTNPMASPAAQRAAIAMIGDLAPEKRMWNELTQLAQGTGNTQQHIKAAERAFAQWQHRNRLPDGVTADPESDMTLFYVNNTIYGQLTGYTAGQTTGYSGDPPVVLDKWHLRGTTVRIKLYNGDYFPHSYANVDFGGLRGWENTFQNTIPVGGAGAWFTFGRAHWWPNTAALVFIPAATRPGMVARPGPTLPAAQLVSAEARRLLLRHPEYRIDWLDPDATHLAAALRRTAAVPPVLYNELGEHEVVITFNYEPSRRLRMYQFDPLHHDEAIWSVH